MYNGPGGVYPAIDAPLPMDIAFVGLAGDEHDLNLAWIDIPDSWEDPSDDEKLAFLLECVSKICDPRAESTFKRAAFERLSFHIHPRQLRAEVKHIFVRKSIERDLVNAAVGSIELGQHDLTMAACNFLGDFCFNSDIGSQSVLLLFGRIQNCFMQILRPSSPERLMRLSSAVSLCANIVATCPCGHTEILPLVRSVFLPTMADPDIPDRLLGNTILLLANLSLTLSSELRSMQVAGVLLNLVLNNAVPVTRKSVAESVIIFLSGDRECEEIDRLMAANVIEGYCIPIMAHALNGEEFRGMYPHLVYSSRLFEVLARSRKYAEALASHEEVAPLLLQACRRQLGQTQLESNNDGRKLAIDALWSLVCFKLWPLSAEDKAALRKELPLLVSDDHVGVRRSAAGLWARLELRWAQVVLLTGHRLWAEGLLPQEVWRQRVVSFLFPLPEHRGHIHLV